MSAVWRRTGQLVTEGIPYREALAQARAEIEPPRWALEGIDEASVAEQFEQMHRAGVAHLWLTEG